VPEVVDLTRVEVDGVLRYGLAHHTDPAGTAELVAILDRLEVPVDAGRPTAAKVLREAGQGARNEVLSAALRVRRNRVMTVGTASGTHKIFQAGDSLRDSSPEPQETHPLYGGTVTGTAGDSTPEASGTRVPPSKGDTYPSLIEEEERVARLARGQAELDDATALVLEFFPGAEDVTEEERGR